MGSPSRVDHSAGSLDLLLLLRGFLTWFPLGQALLLNVLFSVKTAGALRG